MSAQNEPDEREIGRTGGKPVLDESGHIAGFDPEGLVVRHERGSVVVSGAAELTGGLLYDHVKLVMRAAQAASRWRGQREGRDG